LFKLERARLEREKIEEQLRAEKKKANSPTRDADVDDETTTQSRTDEKTLPASVLGHIPPQPINGKPPEIPDTVLRENGTAGVAEEHPNSLAPVTNSGADEIDIAHISDQEHLQLSPEEAFFLSYGLGVLRVTTTTTSIATTTQSLSTTSLFTLFRTPPPFSPPHAHDDPFPLSYAVYHHFRSLGWVVRPGTKFSCDYLLYNRGPVFSHAEFAVVIVPSYTHAYWSSTCELRAWKRERERRPWHWLHCVNRVQSQVKKSLVLAYVEVPPPMEGWCEEAGEEGMEGHGEVDIGRVLRSYRVREFVVRRWLANRSRD
ncbi:tRNA splicing endonuclease subunit sen2, partial [Elasticomyces elasticus]